MACVHGSHDCSISQKEIKRKLVMLFGQRREEIISEE